MDIKFFLPYYLGQQCEVFWTRELHGCVSEGFGKIASIRFDPNPSGSYPVTVRKLIRVNGCDTAEYAYDYADVKPVLRALTDMKEEEAATCFELGNPGSGHQGWEVLDYYKNGTLFLEPPEFHYLLSCGFDLFGLIEAGLAHDKTKTPSI